MAQGFLQLVLRPLEAVFEFGRAPTAGEFRFFRLFEWFIVLSLVWFAWSWGVAAMGPDGEAFSLWVQESLGGVVSGRVIVALNAVIVTILLGLGLFRRWERVAYLGAIPFLHYQFMAPYWPEPGLHHSHLVGMILLGIGTGFLLFRSPGHRLRFGLGMSYVFIAIAYTLAAASKLRQSGFGWVDGENMLMWLTRNQVHRIAKEQPHTFNALQDYVLGNPVVGTMILAPGLVAETFAVLFLIKRLRPYYATLLLLMHVGIAGLMKIYFPWNMAILVLLGFPWARYLDRRSADRTARAPKAQRVATGAPAA